MENKPVIDLNWLCNWLEENSSGVYRPAKEAAYVIRTMTAERDQYKTEAHETRHAMGLQFDRLSEMTTKIESLSDQLSKYQDEAERWKKLYESEVRISAGKTEHLIEAQNQIKAAQEQLPVGIVDTVGGYPDDSEHKVRWLVEHKAIHCGDKLYAAPIPAQQFICIDYAKKIGGDKSLQNPLNNFHDSQQSPAVLFNGTHGHAGYVVDEQQSPTTALEAFEQRIRNESTRGIMADHFLKKLDSFDLQNPEFYDTIIDKEWQVFRDGWDEGNRAAKLAMAMPENVIEAKEKLEKFLHQNTNWHPREWEQIQGFIDVLVKSKSQAVAVPDQYNAALTIYDNLTDDWKKLFKEYVFDTWTHLNSSSPRITEQDAREIAIKFYLWWRDQPSFDRENGFKIWMSEGQEGRALLDKLNGGKSE